MVKTARIMAARRLFPFISGRILTGGPGESKAGGTSLSPSAGCPGTVGTVAVVFQPKVLHREPEFLPGTLHVDRRSDVKIRNVPAGKAEQVDVRVQVDLVCRLSPDSNSMTLIRPSRTSAPRVL